MPLRRSGPTTRSPARMTSPSARDLQAADDAHQGRLAAAGGTEVDGELARLQVHRETLSMTRIGG